jgi:toxin ParE1/3/4
VKRYRVRIIEDAEQDLVDLYEYVARHDSVDSALYVLDQLENLCLSLAELPLRGHVPPELDRVGVTDYREVHFKPYRVVYQVLGSEVLVHCVVDGRRDMQSLLERRLTRVPGP